MGPAWLQYHSLHSRSLSCDLDKLFPTSGPLLFLYPSLTLQLIRPFHPPDLLLFNSFIFYCAGSSVLHRVFSQVAEGRGRSLVVVRGALITVASLTAEHRLHVNELQ